MSDMNIQEANVTAASQAIEKPPCHWDKDQDLGYSCEIRVYKGEDAAFLAYVPMLAGVYGQGDTVPAALDDAAQALATTLKTYAEQNKPIPWRESKPKQPGEEAYRVTVNA